MLGVLDFIFLIFKNWHFIKEISKYRFKLYEKAVDITN